MNTPCYLIRFSDNNQKYVLSIMAENTEGQFIFLDYELVIDSQNDYYEVKDSGKNFQSIDKLLNYYEHNSLHVVTPNIGIQCPTRTRRTAGRGRDRVQGDQSNYSVLRRIELEGGGKDRDVNASTGGQLEIIRELMEENRAYRREMREEQKLHREEMQKILETVVEKTKEPEKKRNCTMM